MVNDLVKKLNEFKNNLILEEGNKRKEFELAITTAEKKAIRNEVVKLDAEIIEIRDALIKFEMAKNNKDKAAYNVALTELFNLAEKYNIEIDTKNKNIEDYYKKDNHIFRNILLGLGIAGISAGVTSCVMNNREVTVAETQNDEEDVKTKKENESKDITLYGMSSKLTDASNEKQVMQRAQDIYDKYVNIDGVPEATKAELSVEKLANVIRMFNGEFALDDGSVDYNETTIDEIANTYSTYCNATSFAEYKNNLKFKPSCVFFEEDTLAHTSALKADELLQNIYIDINNNNVTKFKEDSIKWGEFVRDTFIYQDFTGDTVSIRNVDSEQQFPLAVSIISPYMPSICEYAINQDLASRNNMFGETFGICVPYCYNSNGEMTEVPLSQLIYDINYTSMNDLAVRAGISQEQINNETDPIIVQSYNNTKEWFNSKYNMEKGYTRSLK